MRRLIYYGCSSVISHYSQPTQRRGWGGETVVLTPPPTSPASPIRRGSGHGNVTPDEILINTLNHNEIAAANTEIREEPFYY